MIDTVRLIFSCKERLTPNNSPFQDFSRNPKGFTQAIILGKQLYKERGHYYPTVRYCERPIGGGLRGITWEVSIEFSVPKLLYGNNLYEVDETDRDTIFDVLYQRLQEMGFSFIAYDDIEHMAVRRLDVGKNIPMQNGVEVRNAIRMLGSSDISRWFAESDRTYANGGISVQYRSNDEEIIIYDKGFDLAQASISEKRSLDSEPHINVGLPDPHKLNVLRIELRMVGSKDIKRRFIDAGLSLPKVLEFKDVLRNEVCQKLFRLRFDQLYDKIPKISLDESSPNVTFDNLLAEVASNSSRDTKEVLARVGLQALLNDGLSQRDISMRLEMVFGKKAKATVEALAKKPQGSQVRTLEAVKAAVAEFKVLKPP